MSGRFKIFLWPTVAAVCLVLILGVPLAMAASAACNVFHGKQICKSGCILHSALFSKLEQLGTPPCITCDSALHLYYPVREGFPGFAIHSRTLPPVPSLRC